MVGFLEEEDMQVVRKDMQAVFCTAVDDMLS